MTENSAGPAMTDGLTNKVRVSATAKPLVFYVNLAKKIAESSGTVEISGLGIGEYSHFAVCLFCSFVVYCFLSRSLLAYPKYTLYISPTCLSFLVFLFPSLTFAFLPTAATPSVATISEILRNRHEFHVQCILSPKPASLSLFLSLSLSFSLSLSLTIDLSLMDY